MCNTSTKYQLESFVLLLNRFTQEVVATPTPQMLVVNCWELARVSCIQKRDCPSLSYSVNPSFVTSHPGTQRVQEFLLTQGEPVQTMAAVTNWSPVELVLTGLWTTI